MGQLPEEKGKQEDNSYGSWCIEWIAHRKKLEVDTEE